MYVYVCMCVCMYVCIYIYIYIYVPGVPKKTIHCLISSNVKPIKAIFDKIKDIPFTED